MVPRILFLAVLTFLTMSSVSDRQYLYDFNVNCRPTDWRVVDDVVMGGRSAGHYALSEDGHGIFSGEVSLENNGGFSSVRCTYLEPLPVAAFTAVKLRVRGDGKEYQFRLRAAANDRHSYLGTFRTDGSWQTHTLPFASLYPAFRGRTLNLPNFPGRSVAELAFLIGNGRAEAFRLEIDAVWVE